MYKFVLGIDGGGTKTVCLLADQNGVIRGRGEGGASNPYYVSEENLKIALRQAIGAAITSSSLSQPELVDVCLGVAGAGGQEKQDLIRNLTWEILTELDNRGVRLDSEFESKSRIQVCADTVIILVAGAGSRHGIAVISGTGSIVYGETLSGQTARAGGWGTFLTSEGSGYDIGRRALRAIVRANDGRGEPTLLEPMILERWKCSSPTQLFRHVLSGAPTVADIADLARIVGKAATLGDRVAINILKRAGNELAIGMQAVARRLGFYDQEFPLVLSGGVLLNLELVATELVSRAEGELPLARVIKLSTEPAYGAIIMALRNNGLSLSFASDFITLHH